MLFIAAPAYAGNTHIDSAMNLYKSLQINKAASLLTVNVKDEKALGSIDKLKYALILDKNLSMYKDIYAKSLETQQIFLETLLTDKGKDRSKFASLFLTEVYILQKKYKDAEKQLDDFNTTKDINSEFTRITDIYRAWIAKASGNNAQFTSIKNTIKPDDALTAMAIDVMEILSTGKSQIDLNIVKSAENKYIDKEHIHSNRFKNYAIRIYSHRGELEHAKRLINGLDQRSPSYVEEITQFKLINFYEPSFIDSISSFYYQLAKSILTELEKDPKYHDMAIYYLSDLELIIANVNSAERFKEDMLNLKRLPKGLASLVDIRQNGHGFLYGKTTRAYQSWEKAVNNAKNNPALGAEAILMCIYLDATCPTIVQTARLKAENGRSKKFEGLNTNVGRYFLLKKENDIALRLLGNALDRGNADGILMNEPILLLNLAEIYRLNKRFSESLQIYFSLSQNFPVLRQVQDAVQGEYLFRQRSNGSNTVF